MQAFFLPIPASFISLIYICLLYLVEMLHYVSSPFVREAPFHRTTCGSACNVFVNSVLTLQRKFDVECSDEIYTPS
jgi:hypothetical protein